MWPFGFFNHYPYSDFHELNADWLIETVKKVEAAVNAFIKNWSNPKTVSSYTDFTDTKLIYLYVGDEIGYVKNHWYYYDPDTSTWTDGGLFGSAVVDDALSDTSTNAVQNKVIYEALQRFRSQTRDPAGCIRIAHAGAEDLAPANSTQGIIWAKYSGFDHIELDVRAASDGFVICHNDTTTGFAGYNDYVIRNTPVSVLTNETIISGSYISLYPNLKMMDLETAIKACKRCELIPHLELKDEDLTNDEIQLFYDILKENGIRDNCTVKSFYYGNLDKIKYIDSAIRCELILEDDYTSNIQLAYNHGFDAVDIKIDDVTEARVQAAHDFGLFVNTWTINSQATAKTALDAGADAITTSGSMYWTNGASLDYAIGTVKNIPIFTPYERDQILEGSFINRNYLGSTAKEGIYNTTFNGKYAITTGLIPGNGSGGDIIRFLIPTNIKGAVQGWDSDGVKVYDSGWITGDDAKHSFTSTRNCASYTVTLNRTDSGYLNLRVCNDVFATINVRIN